MRWALVWDATVHVHVHACVIVCEIELNVIEGYISGLT